MECFCCVATRFAEFVLVFWWELRIWGKIGWGTLGNADRFAFEDLKTRQIGVKSELASSKPIFVRPHLRRRSSLRQGRATKRLHPDRVPFDALFGFSGCHDIPILVVNVFEAKIWRAKARRLLWSYYEEKALLWTLEVDKDGQKLGVRVEYVRDKCIVTARN